MAFFTNSTSVNKRLLQEKPALFKAKKEPFQHYPEPNSTYSANISNYLRTQIQLSARIKHLYFNFKTYMFRFQTIYALFLDLIGQSRSSGMVGKPNFSQILNRLLFWENDNNMIRRG